MAEPEATEATINLIYRNYYGEMGGAGAAARPSRPLPRIGPGETLPPRSNAHPLNASPSSASLPEVQRQQTQASLALIFACLVVVYVGIRYLLQ